MPHALALSSTEATSQLPHCRSDSRYDRARSCSLELFASKGFSNVTMRDLATRIGISPGSIYHHVESKEQLLFELIESIYLDLLDLVNPYGVPQDCAKTGVARLIELHLQLHEHKSLYFHLAEHEFHCLSESHKAEVLLLRKQYEEHLTTLLGRWYCMRDTAMNSVISPLLVAMLNNLPAWLNPSALPSAKRNALLVDITLGALTGALHSKALSTEPQE
ncbi:TetR/AcrR family transcriptional regulator [Pseudomonas sp. 9AZ]|uniref:TetR/AcrR family transcriptional regulator n=1 Tax=Pseudomonas sp. 9AZ TaxID=2653168 RepID=UPI0012F40066|nr:TetR/AcrR family transcriptional regulator [Pseudomonas sp. 9AZ]VXD04413.1 TetR/AcrR family transcriptional regulator [Pseudomonas sp. 9AZ]